MKLTLYMYKSQVQDFVNCTKPQTESRRYRDITDYERVENDGTLRIYAIDKEPSTPKWVSFVSSFSDEAELDRLKNQAASALILFKVPTPNGDRIFAASQGFAFNLIDDSHIEQSFGLKVTLNTISPDKIKYLDYKNISARAIQRKEAANLATSIADFGFEYDSEVLKSISGTALDDELGVKLSGADSLRITIKNLRPEQLNDIARKAYDRYVLTTYRAHFDFIDHFEYERDSTRIAELDQKLVDALNQTDTPVNVYVTYPDQIQYEECHHFTLSANRHSENFDDIEIDSLHRFLKSSVGTIGIETLREQSHIIGLDDGGQAMTPRKSIYSFLAYEITLDNTKYVLSDSKWYKLNTDFLTDLDHWLEQNISEASLSLKDWPATFAEGAYNDMYIPETDYLELDEQFYYPKGYSKIEMADIYHQPTNRLVCVKKLSGASSMSHLFTQASVSADLLREDDKKAWEFLIDKLNDKWPALSKESINHGLGYVFAIGDNREIPQELPVFSKIALRKTIKTIQKLGYKAEIKRIRII